MTNQINNYENKMKPLVEIANKETGQQKITR